LAIWAAGRFIVLQQRDNETSVIQGIVGLIGVAVDLLEEASGIARDNVQSAILEFDVYRFDDVTRPLADISIAAARNWQLAASIPKLLRELRAGRGLMDKLVTETRSIPTSLKIPNSPWEELHAIEQRAIGVLAETGRVLTAAQRRRSRWWLW